MRGEEGDRELVKAKSYNFESCVMHNISRLSLRGELQKVFPVSCEREESMRGQSSGLCLFCCC